MIDKASWNNLQLQAEQRDNIGLTTNLARLEEAIDDLNELDFNDSNLNEDLETIIDRLISFWSIIDAKVAKKEQAALQAWINGNDADDWQRYQPQLVSDSVFHSKRQR